MDAALVAYLAAARSALLDFAVRAVGNNCPALLGAGAGSNLFVASTIERINTAHRSAKRSLVAGSIGRIVVRVASAKGSINTGVSACGSFTASVFSRFCWRG